MISPARSVHLWFSPGVYSGCYLRGRVDRFSPGSYFAAIGFRGGYFGIQEKVDRKHVAIFSLWHDGELGRRSVDEMVWAHRIGKHGFVRTFGGEGEGFQSYIPFDWRLGEEIEFWVATEQIDGRTRVSAYLSHGGPWELVSSLSRLGENRLIEGWYAFVEDFRRDKRSLSELRRVTIVDAWAHLPQDKWYPISGAKSSADKTPVTNFDIRIENNCWVMETGGTASNVTPVGSQLNRTTANLQPPSSLRCMP